MKDEKFVCSTEPYAGFMMRFENGFTVSVQWAKGNYCSNKGKLVESHSDMGFVQANTAEVMVWRDDDELNTVIDASIFKPNSTPDIRVNEDSIGYLTPEEVVEFLNNVKNHSGIVLQ